MSEDNQTKTGGAEQSVSEAAPAVSGAKKNRKLPIIAILIIVLIAGYFGLQKFSGTSTDSSSDADRVVATAANGITVTRGELDVKIDQVKRSLPDGSVDPSEDAAFELQLLNDMVSLKLLTALAEEKNYTVTDEEIEAEKTSLIEQLGGEEVFRSQLEMLGITDEELLENMRNELLIRQLLDDETDIDTITVTDEEIAEAYNMAVAGAGTTEGIPSLEDATEILRSEITNQKSSVIIEEYLNSVRDNANIEITL